MIFAPCTEREAIYAALVDREDCLAYLDRVFDDDECDIVATAIMAMQPSGSWRHEGLLVKVIDIGVAGDARRIMAAANVVKPEVEWFRELCMTAGRSIALATEQACES